MKTSSISSICISLIMFFTIGCGFKDRGGTPVDHKTLESLKAREAERIIALNARDVNTIVDIEGVSRGFGRASTASRQHEPSSYKQRIERWLEGMDQFEIELLDAEYCVVGQTGLVLGILVRKEQNAEGEVVIRRLRYSATYVHDGKRWYMVQYHRSPLPVTSNPR